MLRLRIAALAAILLAVPMTPAGAQDLETKKSAHSVSQTMDRLAAALEEKGITVVARIDHAAGAQKAGLTLKPTQVLIFGNPKLGTPLMAAERKIGLDLPMKVLAWEDDKGDVWVAYAKPEDLKQRYGVSGQDKVFETMAGALANFTSKAAAAE